MRPQRSDGLGNIGNTARQRLCRLHCFAGGGVARWCANKCNPTAKWFEISSHFVLRFIGSAFLLGVPFGNFHTSFNLYFRPLPVDCYTHTNRCLTVLQKFGLLDEEKNRKIVSLHSHTHKIKCYKINSNESDYADTKCGKSMKYATTRWTLQGVFQVHLFHLWLLLLFAVKCSVGKNKNPWQLLIIRDLLDFSFVFSDPPGLWTKRYFFLNISTFRNFGFASVTL